MSASFVGYKLELCKSTILLTAHKLKSQDSISASVRTIVSMLLKLSMKNFVLSQWLKRRILIRLT